MEAGHATNVVSTINYFTIYIHKFEFNALVFVGGGPSGGRGTVDTLLYTPRWVCYQLILTHSRFEIISYYRSHYEQVDKAEQGSRRGSY